MFRNFKDLTGEGIHINMNAQMGLGYVIDTLSNKEHESPALEKQRLFAIEILNAVRSNQRKLEEALQEVYEIADARSDDDGMGHDMDSLVDGLIKIRDLVELHFVELS